LNAATARTQLPQLSANAWLRWAVVSRLLPPADPAYRVLEVGCGQGGFGARFSQRYDYTGIELDPVSCEAAKQRVAEAGGGGEVRLGDFSVLEPGETFDLVCAFEVIEHIEDDHDAIRAWAEPLRPGGTMLLSTPAWQHRFGAADEMVGHFRRYDPPVMRDLLDGAGLVDITIQHFGAPLGYVLEAGRNFVGKRRARAAADSDSMADRTGASGRLLQPASPLASMATRYGTAPFRAVQRAFPNTGPGLVALAHKPR
jgi:SAM-dependent methyltransferase